MAKSDSRFGYEAKMGRDAHNLSQPLGFTSAPGMLLPIWFDFATPGDSYYMQHDLPLLRSIQLLAPSMVDVKVHYETFFVPIQMIYQPAENTFFSLQNLQSSLYENTPSADLLNNSFPCLNYDAYITKVKNLGGEYLHDAFRLADLMGLGSQNFVSYGLTAYKPNFFPWQICAYHTIFQYYYRLDDKSQFNSDMCNIDDWFRSTVVDFVSPEKVLSIHQRPWDFDYFTSMYRSPIVSDANVQDILSSADYSFLNDGKVVGVSSDGYTIPSNNVDKVSFSYNAPGINADVVRQGVNTSMIRQLFANEKLAMITGRTRKNYDSQVLAHYGVNVPHDVKHDLTMIHHDEYDLTVQEVTSLANTDNSPLGELAGKSFSAGNGKEFKFTAPCHGVLMTIFSIEPKKRYVTGFDRINSVSTAFDLPTPEFDRLGNVPMYRYECGFRSQIGPTQRSNSDIIGWKERYYQFKRKPARCTMAFFSNNGVNDWGSYFLSGLPFGELTRGASLAPSGDPRPDLEDRFYIERGAVDAMCALPYFSGWKAEAEGENWNTSPWQAYTRDPFIVNSHIKCKKVSWMSKDGEPVYVY